MSQKKSQVEMVAMCMQRTKAMDEHVTPKVPIRINGLAHKAFAVGTPQAPPRQPWHGGSLTLPSPKGRGFNPGRGEGSIRGSTVDRKKCG